MPILVLMSIFYITVRYEDNKFAPGNEGTANGELNSFKLS